MSVSAPTKKISIAQLKPGMFIHELDIPWLQSPFLRHRRKINSQKDILLLKKAAVKELVIDLQRGDDVSSGDTPAQVQETEKNIPVVDKPVEEKTTTEKQVEGEQKSVSEKKAKLNEELKVARVLQGKISRMVNELGNLVKEGRPIAVQTINPLIDEARDSLVRNDQALLTMLHLHRQDIKLSDHGFGVFAVVLPLAMRLGRSDQDISDLGLAALLHDTGWARLPIHLLGKNKAYTEMEQKLIHQHPGIVKKVLQQSEDVPENVIKLVTQHHEFSDGSGYPKHLKDTEIFELVEILQVADFYDEFIHGLTDKPGMLPVNALKLLYQLTRKGQFREEIVGELIHVMGIYPLTSAVRLSSGEKGLVIEIDKQKPLFPQVKIIYEADGKRCIDERIVDLSHCEQNDLRVAGVIEPLDQKEDPMGLLRVSHA